MVSAVPLSKVAFVAVLLCFGVGTAHGSSALCASFNDAVNGAYWEQVANCSACAAQQGCGYCHSTLQCAEGDSHGAFDGAVAHAA